MPFFSRKHKNISTSPEISTRSPRLIKPGWWITSRLPKPSQRQLAHLSSPVHSLKGRQANSLNSPVSTWHRDAAHRPHMPPQHDSLHSAPSPELYRSTSALSRHVSTAGLEEHHSHALLADGHPHPHPPPRSQSQSQSQSQRPRRVSAAGYGTAARHSSIHL
jgi:hypothetical protein